jgi:hypothetical protein
MAKLITEVVEDVRFLNEEKDGKKSLFIEGVFLQSNVKNRNGRIYPPPVLEREAARYMKEKVEKNCAFGELGHPATPGLNLHLVSHRVTELKRDGDNWVGKALVLDTPNGKIVESFVNSGSYFGVSSRGMGSLKEDKRLGAQVVQDDYHLHVAADIVGDPSGPDCWVNGVMEGVEWTLNDLGEWVQEKVGENKQVISKLSLREISEQKTKLFEKFVWELNEDFYIKQLAKKFGVKEEEAKSALTRARIGAGVTRNHGDQRWVYTRVHKLLKGED